MTLGQAIGAAALGYASMFLVGIAVSLQGLWARMSRRGLNALREEFSSLEGWAPIEAEIERRWRHDLIVKTLVLVNVLVLFIFITIWAGIVVASSEVWWGHLLAFACGGGCAIIGLIYIIDARRERSGEHQIPSDWEMFASLYRARFDDLTEARRLLQVEHERLRNDRDAALEEWVHESEQLTRQQETLRELRNRLELANSRLPTRARVPAEGTIATTDPAAEFLAEVEAAWRRRFSAADRLAHPLAPARVGWGFLDSLDDVAVSRAKIVEVCMEIACGVAFRVRGREVHRMRVGPGPEEPQRERSSDGAKAWRCALKRNSPAAPRLHWWALAGGGVEFANCVRHDDDSMPE